MRDIGIYVSHSCNEPVRAHWQENIERAVIKFGPDVSVHLSEESFSELTLDLMGIMQQRMAVAEERELRRDEEAVRQAVETREALQ